MNVVYIHTVKMDVHMLFVASERFHITMKLGEYVNIAPWPASLSPSCKNHLQVIPMYTEKFQSFLQILQFATYL